MSILIKKIMRKIFSIFKNIILLMICSIKTPSRSLKYLKLFIILNTKGRRVSSTNILDRKLLFVDSATFSSMYNEIFEKEIYKFVTPSPTPYIIDGGANIGLATIYFKKIYPNSKIIAFEPDKKIAEIFKKNIISFNFKDVDIIEKGLWNKNDNIQFYSEGTDSGRVQEEKIEGKMCSIPVVSLRTYLNQPVDFLKLDIEGAETVVLEDCRDLLINVKNLFVEYHSFDKEKQTLNLILDIISSSGFRYYMETVGVSSTNPFIKINSFLNMDLQINIYAYRV